jgi:RNA polymerase subunit RPABC4/transcription elongation factor Spt4
MLFNNCLFCSTSETLSSHLTFKICHRHQFTNTWNELLIILANFHIAHPCDRTSVTFVLTTEY